MQLALSILQQHAPHLQAKLCLKPTSEIGHGLTRMHTDEIGLTHPCFSVFVRVPNLASIEFMRAGEYGEMTVQFTKGEPKISRVTLDFRHGKLKERQAALALLPSLREKYEEETLSLQ